MSVKPSGRSRQDRRGGVAERQRGGQAAALGNNANNSSPRQQRYSLRADIQRFTGLGRVQKCGRCPRGEYVTLRSADDGKAAGWGNLTTCGSAWACPVCSAKIAARRAQELGGVLSKADAAGYRVSMMTLTMRHHRGQRLEDLWDALGYAWGKVTSGKGWVREKEDFGLLGWARAVEVTHGANGWHVHIHVAWVTEADPTKTDAPERIWGRWVRALARRGLDAVMGSGGFDWTVAAPGDSRALAGYVAKMNTAVPDGAEALAAEATLGAFKKARGDNRTPFQIAADIATTGDADDLDLWLEYERVSHGKRALTWSRALREFGKVEDVSDEEIAAEEVGDEVRALVPKDEWRTLYAESARVLDVCEADGVQAALSLLDELEVRWRPPEPCERDRRECRRPV